MKTKELIEEVEKRMYRILKAKEKEMAKDEISWLEDLWEDRASYSLTQDAILIRYRKLKQKVKEQEK